MLRVLWTALIVIATAALLTGCDHTTGGGITDMSSKTTMTDAQLENSIRSKLDSDAQLKAANLRISANAARNEATLSGAVDSQASRTRAVELAKSGNASLVITDNITVKPRTSP